MIQSASDAVEELASALAAKEAGSVVVLMIQSVLGPNREYVFRFETVEGKRFKVTVEQE